jgi:DNA-binding transcriptional regulator YdaS (Cro superfamily)
MEAGTTPFEALQASVDQVGSQSAFARLCGVSQTAVWKWLQSGKRLPAEHVLAVEAKTGVSRHVLRPDIYPRGEAPAAPAGAIDGIGDSMPAVAFHQPAGMKRAAGA